MRPTQGQIGAYQGQQAEQPEGTEKMKVGGKKVHRVIKDYELLEVSMVSIPSNQDALVKSLIKAIDKDIAEAKDIPVDVASDKEYDDLVSKNATLKAKVAELEFKLEEQATMKSVSIFDELINDEPESQPESKSVDDEFDLLEALTKEDTDYQLDLGDLE